jgi:hypothetical protein
VIENVRVCFTVYYVIHSDLPADFGDSGAPVFFWGNDPCTASESTLIGHFVALGTYIASVSAVIYSGFRPITINP